MIKVEECALCNHQTRLLKSHIIPKFAVDWLKRTSATGYMRQVIKPNLRKQDIDKLRLLCTDCENRFSKWEKQFAENIFIPFQEKYQQSFEYREWLLLFAVSLAWRTVIKEIESFRKLRPELSPFVYNALNHWSAFLLGKSADPGPYEHHMLLLDFIANAQNIDLPDGIHWYLLRGIDSTIVSSSKKVFAYTKLPGLIFWTAIQPPKPEGWEKTQIFRSGIIGTPQSITQPEFGPFLLDRIKITDKILMSDISERQMKQIEQCALKNPEKVIASRSFEVHLAERFWQERKKK